MKEIASSVTLDVVKKYHQGKVPSTHAHSSRVDKSIILARVEGSVEKLKVYLAPFLHGMRYTSYGRHFTKIVDKLHWYVEDGDMIVDFCCGANDFNFLMKKRLDETGKMKCSYKNFDFRQPKVMGLTPLFGKNVALANKFIDSALKFKPKLIILVVLPETERYKYSYTHISMCVRLYICTCVMCVYVGAL
ncbi:hypothetical protein Hdeb2414_s0022g00612211 [Helianthus debilis subsp. tardiflorus]